MATHTGYLLQTIWSGYSHKPIEEKALLPTLALKGPATELLQKVLVNRQNIYDQSIRTNIWLPKSVQYS